jgi:hypothetical protein
VDRVDLTAAERELWDAFADGTRVDLGGPDPNGADVQIEDWTGSCTVRADVVVALLLGAAPTKPGSTARLHLHGARIVGKLHLGDGDVDFSIGIIRCWFDESVELGDARTRGIWIRRCRIPAIDAVAVVTAGPFLIENCRLDYVDLTEAHIQGRLDLTGTTLLGPDRVALEALSMTVTQDFFLSRKSSIGTAVLTGSTIAGALHIDPDNPPAICLDNVRYAALQPDTPVNERLQLLRSDPHGYHPQPYEQLAAYYHSVDHDQEHRAVRLARQRARRRTLTPWRRAGSAALDAIAGYGYAPGRALAILAAAAVAGMAYFLNAPPSPVSGNAGFDALSAALYVIDALLPTSPLGQERRWEAHTAAASNVLTALHVLGWLLSIAIIPAVARALGRR